MRMPALTVAFVVMLVPSLHAQEGPLPGTTRPDSVPRPDSSAVPASPARYRPTSDTLRYLSTNNSRVYFMRGADTIGAPTTSRTLESRTISPDGRGLAVWVRLEGVGTSPFKLEETYTVDSTGRLRSVGGRPVEQLPGARVDLLPRFPAGQPDLVPGLSWVDTVSSQGRQPHGETFYRVRREYRVLRLVDSLGTTLAELVAQGRMHLRQGGWQDQAKTAAWWQEVAGPVADTVWIDTRRGTLVASIAVMHLTGTGGVGDGAPVPSGLQSTVRLGPP